MTAVPTTTEVARPRAEGFGCAINDLLFRLAVGPGRELSIQTVPLEPPRVDTASSPEEMVEDFGKVFARSQFDGGAGLFRAHVAGASPSRFWDSKGVSVAPAEPGEFPEVTLLRATGQVHNHGQPVSRYVELDGVLYGPSSGGADRVAFSSSPFAVWTEQVINTGSTVNDLAVLGNQVYAALATVGIYRGTAGSWAAWSNLVATRLWSVKSRIVASNGPSLYEVIAAGVAPAPLRTLAAGETWEDVCDGGSHVLAAASDGYVYGYREVEGVLTLTGQTLFDGERPTAVGQAQGVVAVATRQQVGSGAIGRLWVGSLAETGELVDLRLIRQWGDRTATVDYAPRSVFAGRESLVVGVPDELGTTSNFLWRYDLTTAGLSRYLELSGTLRGATRSILAVRGVMFAAVDDYGLWRETDTYVDEGYLIGPLGDFAVASEKAWVGAKLETGTLEGTSVELLYTTDPDDLADPESTTWRRLISRSAPATEEVAMTNVSARSLAGMVVLKASSDGTVSPSVRSFSFRAFASSGEEDVVITLPINVSDQVERPGRRRTRIKGRGNDVYAQLKTVENKPALLTLYSPTERVRGIVESVGTPVPGLSRRGSPTMYSEVRVRGRRVGTSGSIVDGTFGTFAFGEAMFGGISPSGV